MRLFSRPNDSLLGISISSTLLTMVVISYKQGRYHLQQYGLQPLLEGEVVDHDIVDAELMGQHIKNLVKQLNIVMDNVAIDISHAQAIIKFIEVSAELEDIEIEAQIRIDADQYIPYPLAEVSFDFEVLGPSPSDSSMVQVLLVATHTATIEQRVDSLVFAGLHAKVVELDLHAMERAFRSIYNNLPDQPPIVALLDIGHSRTTLYIVKEGEFVYHCDQLFGGIQLTQSIQQGYDLSYSDAHQAKCQWGKDFSETPSCYKALYFQPFIRQLIHHIKQALQPYFDSHDFHPQENEQLLDIHQDLQIAHVVLCGGSACLPDIDTTLQHELGLAVNIANPFADMVIEASVDSQQLQKDAPRLMTACGLSLWRKQHHQPKNKVYQSKSQRIQERPQQKLNGVQQQDRLGAHDVVDLRQGVKKLSRRTTCGLS